MKSIDFSLLEMRCLYMPDNINYYLKSIQELTAIADCKQKPSLLMHVCCGPCTTYPLMFLTPYFNVTLFFNNSNIYPKNEYTRRLEELKKFLFSFQKDFGYEVKLVTTHYDNENYNKILEPFKNEKEGLNRCRICYRKRMSEAFNYAEAHHYDFFTTVMTISTQKDSQVLNQIGNELSKFHPNCKYFYSDFKKHKGMDMSRYLTNKYQLYRQNYCGCIFSIRRDKQ